MKSASVGLISHLNTQTQYKIADLLAITNINGGLSPNMYLTGADFPIIKGGNTHLPASDGSVLAFKRSNIKVAAGLAVDKLQLKLMGTTTSYGGIPFQQFASNGGLDGARVELYRAFMPDYGDTSLGFVWMFSGRLADMDILRNEINLEANSDIELLDTPYPKNLYQKGCTNDLFGPACGVNRATYAVTRTGTAGGSTTAIKLTDAAASGYYDLGVARCITGANAGAKRTIKSFVAGSPATVNVALPLPYTPNNGDTWELVPGCDKTKPGGCTKFSNTARFRGFRFIPRPETVR